MALYGRLREGDATGASAAPSAQGPPADAGLLLAPGAAVPRTALVGQGPESTSEASLAVAEKADAHLEMALMDHLGKPEAANQHYRRSVGVDHETSRARPTMLNIDMRKIHNFYPSTRLRILLPTGGDLYYECLIAPASSFSAAHRLGLSCGNISGNGGVATIGSGPYPRWCGASSEVIPCSRPNRDAKTSRRRRSSCKPTRLFQ